MLISKLATGLLLLAGCRSERAVFQFLPVSSAAPQIGPVAWSSGAPLPTQPAQQVAIGTTKSDNARFGLWQPVGANRSARRRTPPNTSFQTRFAVLMPVHLPARHLRNYSRKTSSTPENAGFWLALSALVLLAGGIFLIASLGGWVGITTGILAIFFGFCVGVLAGALGEFALRNASSSAASFSQLHSITLPHDFYRYLIASNLPNQPVQQGLD